MSIATLSPPPPVIKTYTVAELDADPDHWERFELYQGEPIEMPYTTCEHGDILSNITFIIKYWIRFGSGSGKVYVGEGGARLTPITRYCYDLAWTPDATLTGIPTHALPLMVEVISDSNTIDKTMTKVEDYLTYGATEVWLVYIDKPKLQVYNKTGSMTVYRPGDTYTPGDWMPGFNLNISDIFKQ